MNLLTTAWGEFRQRLREPGFIVLLVALAAGTTFLVPAKGAGYSTMTLARHPIFGGSGFAGTSAGMDFAVFSGFFCIFALAGGFSRDDRTRLSELLRAQPMPTIALVGGRILSSWMLGASITLGAMLLLGITLAFRLGNAFDALQYAAIFLTLALPGMCLIASLAVVLDMLVGRWRGWLVPLGLFGYIMLVGISTASTGTTWLDFPGISIAQQQFSRATGAHGDLSGGLLVEANMLQPIYWDGLKIDAAVVRERSAIVAVAVGAGLLALALYRRRRGVLSFGRADAPAIVAPKIEIGDLHAPPMAKARSFMGRVAFETLVRFLRHRVLAIASAALFIFALLGARGAQYWVVMLAMLLPLAWIRVFDDSQRTRALDETLASLPGGRAADWSAKFATLLVLCVLPLVGLLIGNPGDPSIFAAAAFGIAAEIAWLAAVAWLGRAELLALGVVALWWYVAAFNNVPPPVDYAGLWSVSTVTFVADAAVIAAVLAASRAAFARAQA